jgi:hypothetical protein
MKESMKMVDEKLAQTDDLRALVHGLPEDSVNLQWRSELNEKILAMAAKPKRNPFALLWRLSSGVAVAGALAIAFVANQPAKATHVAVNASKASILSEAILDAHETSYAYREMGVTMPESNGQPLINLVDNTEELDLGTL